MTVRVPARGRIAGPDADVGRPAGRRKAAGGSAWRRRAEQRSCAILVSHRVPNAGENAMKIPKPTEADRERFTGLVPDPRVSK